MVGVIKKLFLLIIFVLVSSVVLSVTTSDDFYLGSYNSVIKISPNISDQEDWNSIMIALEDSNHNFYGYPAGDGEAGDDGTGWYWQNFLELLEVSDGTDIKVFAVVPESHQLLEAVSNRWGKTRDSSREEWYESHLQAAEEFSQLATRYPNFIGWTVDDIGPKICNPQHVIRKIQQYKSQL